MTKDVSLERWVGYLFDHPVMDPYWYWQEEYEYLDPGAIRTAELIAETFERSGELLSRFSDAQLNQAFWFSVGSDASNYMFALRDESVPWEVRRRATRSFAALFEQLMAVRCTPALSHFDEAGAGPLNSACYMWWEIIPICSSKKLGGAAELDAECLGVMERILRIPHVACQESALHGLGHWKFDHPEEVERIIDQFLNRHGNLRPDLISYAKAAKTGCIQ